MVGIEWKRQPDGSYLSVAGRVWRHPGEKWGSCCITPAEPVVYSQGRVGNLPRWDLWLRCTFVRRGTGMPCSREWL